MSSRDRHATPILDAVRRQRGELAPGRDPYNAKPAPDPWAPAFPGHSTPEQRATADAMLSGTALTLED